MKYEIYKRRTWMRRSTQWRWRLLAANNKIIAVGGESYNNYADCAAAVSLVQGSASARVVLLADPTPAKLP